MATVTGYTAERMKAIEDRTIVSGLVGADGHLILTSNSGENSDAGSVWDGSGIFEVRSEVNNAIAKSNDARNEAELARDKALNAFNIAESASVIAQTADGRYTIGSTTPTTADSINKPLNAVWEVRTSGSIGKKYVLTEPGTWTRVTASQDFIGDKAIGTAQIGDLAVGTAQVVDASITNAKIGDLSVGKLTVTEGAEFPTAVVTTLVGQDVFAQRMYASSLIVASDNLQIDPYFDGFNAVWDSSAGTPTTTGLVTTVTYGGHNYGYQLVQKAVDITPKTLSGPLPRSVKDNCSQCVPGETLWASCMFYLDSALPSGSQPGTDLLYGFGIVIDFYDKNGTSLGSQTATLSKPKYPTPGQWFKVGGDKQITVPPNAFYTHARPTIEFLSTYTPNSAKMYIGYVELRRSNGTVSITPGAITAESAILADASVITAKIADLAVTDAKIQNATISSAKIKDLSADKITAPTTEFQLSFIDSLYAKRVILGSEANLWPNGWDNFTDARSMPTVIAYNDVVADQFPGMSSHFTVPASTSTTYIFNNNDAVSVNPGEHYLIDVWLRASVENTKFYLEIKDQLGNQIPQASFTVLEGPSSGTGAYILTDIMAPTTNTHWLIDILIPATTNTLKGLTAYFNHSDGSVYNAAYAFALRLRRRLNNTILEDNSITTEKFRADAIDGMVITGATFKTDSQDNIGLIMDNTGLTLYNADSVPTFSLSSEDGSVQIYPNVIDGSSIKDNTLNSNQIDITDLAPAIGSEQGFADNLDLSSNPTVNELVSVATADLDTTINQIGDKVSVTNAYFSIAENAQKTSAEITIGSSRLGKNGFSLILNNSNITFAQDGTAVSTWNPERMSVNTLQVTNITLGQHLIRTNSSPIGTIITPTTPV